MNFQQSQQSPPAQPAYSDKQFLHTQTAAVVVPLMQSAVTGGIVFFVALVIAFKVDALDLFTWPLLFGVLSFGGMWMWLQRRWITLTNLERWIGADLNGDAVIGEPKQAKEPTVIRIEHIEAGRYQSRDVNLSADEDQLVRLADGFMQGRRFTEKEWTPTSRGFSTEEFRLLRSEMIKGGLIVLKVEGAPQQGFVLTEDGQEWCKRYATHSPTMSDEGE